MVVLLVAVGGAGLVVQNYVNRFRTNLLPLLAGIGVVGLALYLGTGDRLQLQQLSPRTG